MAKNSIRDFDNTSGNNTDIQSVDISEGCSPAGINNAIREMMADLADVNDGTVALTSPSADSMTVTGDLTVDTNTLHVDSTNNRVGIGTATPDTSFDVAGNGVPVEVESTNSNGFKVQLKDAGTIRGYIGSTSTAPFYIGDPSANVIFQSQSAGNIVQTSSISAGWSYAHNMTASSGQLLGQLIQFTAQAPNNASNYFLWMTDNIAARAYFKSDGGLANFQGNNANLSDEREKKNIEDAQDAWATVKSWQVRKFHFNEDADSDNKKYGVIAQEFQAHCPELITNYNKSPDPTSDPVTRLAVKEQGAMWLAIKALQEAQAKIEALETKVASLETQNADFETRLTALEAE